MKNLFTAPMARARERRDQPAVQSTCDPAIHRGADAPLQEAQISLLARFGKEAQESWEECLSRRLVKEIFD